MYGAVKLGLPMSEQEMHALFHDLDTDNTGFITKEKFRRNVVEDTIGELGTQPCCLQRVLLCLGHCLAVCGPWVKYAGVQGEWTTWHKASTYLGATS